VKIIVRKRTDDWVAFLEGRAATWESGRTQEEAIGKLVITYAACWATIWPIKIEVRP